VVLEEPLQDAPMSLLRGVGEGRDAGFGALLPHPGIAQSLDTKSPALRSMRSKDQAGGRGLKLWQAAGEAGPSPSQIGSILGRLGQGKASTLEYLRRRKVEASNRVWRRWKPVWEEVINVVDTMPEAESKEALRVWQHLAIVHRGKEDR